MTDLPTGYEFSTDVNRTDRTLVHRWMSEQAYWALGRTREAQEAAIDNSRNYGIFGADGTQVAYARVVTDGATFAWLCDVFVDEAVRGLDLGKVLVRAVIADLDASGVLRTLLATSTAHGLYERFGYSGVEPAENWMIRFLPVSDDDPDGSVRGS